MNTTWSSPSSRARTVQRTLTACLALLVVLISALAGQPAATAGAPASSRSTPDLAAIDRYVESERRATNLPGLALGIVRGDQIVHLRGFGAADQAGRPVTPQTPFVIGSTSKSFTALAIMQLVEAGKLELDAPVQRYVPWFRVADADESARITVRHLLNQTSGLSRMSGNQNLYRRNLGGDALEREARALRTVRLARPPGTAFEYSNLNYALLGLLVQTVTGQPYERYVHERIFGPLGMRDSFAVIEDAQRHGLATGHQAWFSRYRPTPADAPYNRAYTPAGWLSASAADMARYLVAQLNDGRLGNTVVLSAAGIATLHRPAVKVLDLGRETGDAYGMGWAIGPLGGVPAVWHSGSTGDFHANIVLVPQDGWGVVVLANGEDFLRSGRIDTIATGVTSLLVGRQPPPAPFERVALVLFAALAVAVLQVLAIARSAVLLRRWRAQPASTPSRAPAVARRIALPFALSLAWALLCLAYMPRYLSIPLQQLVRTDFGAVLVASGALVLGWGVVRAALATALVLRGRAAGQAGHLAPAPSQQRTAANARPARPPESGAAKGAPTISRRRYR